MDERKNEYYDEFMECLIFYDTYCTNEVITQLVENTKKVCIKMPVYLAALNLALYYRLMHHIYYGNKEKIQFYMKTKDEFQDFCLGKLKGGDRQYFVQMGVS